MRSVSSDRKSRRVPVPRDMMSWRLETQYLATLLLTVLLATNPRRD
jgi:hypothetical protein